MAANRCGREKRKIDFRGFGLVSGIGRRVVVKVCMSNQKNLIFVEESDRKKKFFFEKWSSVVQCGVEVF